MPRGSFNAAPLYGIVRSRHRWVVRLVRDGVRYEKGFSDLAYGSEQAALAHATHWRDQIVRQHRPTPRCVKMMRPRGGSGPIPGVTCELDRQGRVKLWRAKTYVGDGKVLQKTFSIAAHGDAAQRLAIEQRHRQLALVKGLSSVHPAEPLLRASAPSRRALRGLPPPLAAHEVARSSNTSGFPGVVRRARHWTAQTTRNGQWVSQSFRVDRYGEEVALILATWARLDQLAHPGAHGRPDAGRP